MGDNSVSDPSHPRPTAPPPPPHVPELDAVRALAIGSVFCLHWLPRTHPFNRFQDQTFNGVHAFFVLSGLLITGVLLRARAALDAGTISPAHAFRQFFARRALRIFPVYYAALTVGAALGFAGVRYGLWWHAAYLSNVYYFRTGRFDGPASLFWSLAVEEQAYLLWPAVVLLLPRRRVLPATLATALAGAAVRAAVLLAHSRADLLLPACANFLAAGAAVAVAGHPGTGSPAAHRRVTRTFLTVVLACLAGSLLVLATRGWDVATHTALVRVFNQTAAAAGLAVAFDQVARRGRVPGPLGTLMRWPPLVYLGRISYGLYAYHLFVTSALDAADVHAFTARFAASVAVATLSWFAMERPLNQLKNRFPYTR